MKINHKRIQLIYYEKKFWQIIDSNQMITIEHVWRNLKKNLAKQKYKFFDYQTKQLLPEWYHIECLKDNHQILIEDDVDQSKSLIETMCLKHTSKKKQLNTYLTNRSFILTNKYSIPKNFYQQWEEGKMNKMTRNYQIIF